jgi:hypothetical protein
VQWKAKAAAPIFASIRPASAVRQGGRRPPADYPNRKEQTMSAKAFLAILIGASLTVSATTAQAIYEGVHGPDNQVVVGGKVIGKDPDPNVRLEIWRRKHSLGGG